MNSAINNKMVVILGPTASGKSDFAIRLALKFNGEIISADSRQIYRGMDIGTGKISRDKRFNLSCIAKVEPWTAHGIPHYMIDIASPNTNYNAAKFKNAADKIITDILSRGKLPIICGGTGFWIKAVVDNVVFPEVRPDKVLRDKLRNKSAKKLFATLEKLDPQRAKTIDNNNKVRLIRAIEIARTLDSVPSCNSRHTTCNFLQIGVDISKEKLHQNIKKRLKKRWKQGMIAEVKKLKKSGLSWKKIQSFGLGYFWIPLYLQRKISRGELYEKVYLAEKDYAKRQMTWFRKDQRICWIGNYRKMEHAVASFLSL